MLCRFLTRVCVCVVTLAPERLGQGLPNLEIWAQRMEHSQEFVFLYIVDLVFNSKEVGRRVYFLEHAVNNSLQCTLLYVLRSDT